MNLLDTLKQSRSQATDLATRVGRERVLSVLRRADRELVARLHQDPYLRGHGTRSFTATQMQSTLAQIRDVTRHVVHGIEKVVTAQGLEATDAAVGNTIGYLERAEKEYRGVGSQPLAINEAAMLDHVGQGVNSSILRRLVSSGVNLPEGTNAPFDPTQLGILQRYGMNTIGNFEQTLQQGVLQKKSWADVRGSLVEDSPFLQGAPAHWAERIVRTETMGASNRANWETIRHVDEKLGDMVKILSATFDDRTGWDSYQVHGQIRRPEQAFEWMGEYYQHPPNRPNDREIVVPHRISWSIPTYLRWRSESEVERRYHMQRKHGTPGPRPTMTTVDLSKFGH